MTPSDLRLVRWMLAIVTFGLFVSGVTVFPALPELRWCVATGMLDPLPAVDAWIRTCITALEETNQRSPFLLYAGDWLAFAHIMLAVLFAGAAKDPVRNAWIVDFGLICCISIVPLAFICGPIRGIPLFWTMVDVSFAPAAAIPLWLARRAIQRSA